MKKVKVKYHVDIESLKQKPGSDFIDLRCAEPIDMKAGDYKQISLGVSIELPKGYEAYIIPRSSTYRQHHIIMANSFALIDNDYNGNNDIWKFPAIAMKDTQIKKGTRICQFRIQKSQPKIKFVEVNALRNKDRKGLGSTGEA